MDGMEAMLQNMMSMGGPPTGGRGGRGGGGGRGRGGMPGMPGMPPGMGAGMPPGMPAAFPIRSRNLIHCNS